MLKLKKHTRIQILLGVFFLSFLVLAWSLKWRSDQLLTPLTGNHNEW